MMENMRNRVDIKLVTNEKQTRKLISKPNFYHRNIFCDHLVAIHSDKTKVVLNKPMIVGQAILDLSRILMYKFLYDYIKPKYGDKAKFLFTDTDSLMIKIETDDFYKDILPDVTEMFDTSNFPKDYPSGIPTGLNKKVIGMFKDEAGEKQITEFPGPRAKVYAYLMDDDHEVKKCKGVKKTVIKNEITFQNVKDCILKHQTQMRQMNVIRSHKHVVYTERVNKVALSHEDDKRVIMEDGVYTLAHGRYLSKVRV